MPITGFVNVFFLYSIIHFNYIIDVNVDVNFEALRFPQNK